MQESVLQSCCLSILPPKLPWVPLGNFCTTDASLLLSSLLWGALDTNSSTTWLDWGMMDQSYLLSCNLFTLPNQRALKSMFKISNLQQGWIFTWGPQSPSLWDSLLSCWFPAPVITISNGIRKKSKVKVTSSLLATNSQLFAFAAVGKHDIKNTPMLSFWLTERLQAEILCFCTRCSNKLLDLLLVHWNCQHVYSKSKTLPVATDHNMLAIRGIILLFSESLSLLRNMLSQINC